MRRSEQPAESLGMVGPCPAAAVSDFRLRGSWSGTGERLSRGRMLNQ